MAKLQQKQQISGRVEITEGHKNKGEDFSMLQGMTWAVVDQDDDRGAFV